MFRRLILFVLVIAALAPVLSGDAAPPVLIARGVTLAGVPVGGMSNEQAQAALRPAFARPVRLVYGDRSWRLRPTRFGAKVAIADGVSRALHSPPHAAVPLEPQVNVDSVRSFVKALDARISYPAQDAELAGLVRLVPQFTPEKPGVQLLRAVTTKRILRALRTPAVRRVRVAVRPAIPERTLAHFGPVVVIRRGVNELRYYQGTKLIRRFGVATGQSVYPTPT